VLQFLSRLPSNGDSSSEHAESVVLYDPVPMPLARLAFRDARASCWSKHRSAPPLHQFLDAWLTAVRTVKAPRHLRWAIDVDPLAILTVLRPPFSFVREWTGTNAKPRSTGYLGARRPVYGINLTGIPVRRLLADRTGPRL